jgi:hypothetical protein
MLAAMYMITRVQARTRTEGDPASSFCGKFVTHGEGTAGSGEGVTHLVCYNPFFAIYMLATTSFMSLLLYGTTQIAPSVASSGDTCLLYTAVADSLELGVTYVGLAFPTFCLSLGCLKRRSPLPR